MVEKKMDKIHVYGLVAGGIVAAGVAFWAWRSYSYVPTFKEAIKLSLKMSEAEQEALA